MHSYSRRDFGRLVIAGVPISIGLACQRPQAAAGLRVGLTTESFRELPRVPGRDNIDDVLRSVQTGGVREFELWAGNVEPAAPNSGPAAIPPPDRKSTRLNSSHGYISYAVFCLKKYKTNQSINHKNQPHNRKL